MKKNVLCLSVMVLSLFPYIIWGQATWTVNNGRGTLKVNDEILGEHEKSGVIPSTSTRTSSPNTPTFSDMREAAKWAYDVTDAQADAANDYARRIDADRRASAQAGSNASIPNRLTGFTKMTEAQQRAFDYFVRLELNSGKNITASGTSPLTRAADASTKGAASTNSTTALAYAREANSILPEPYDGMTVDVNDRNRVAEAVLKSKLEQYRQLSDKDKQTVYENAHSELAYRRNEAQNIKNEMNELDNNYRNVMQYLNSHSDIKKQSEISQQYNKKAKELNEAEKNVTSREGELKRQIEEYKKLCPTCII